MRSFVFHLEFEGSDRTGIKGMKVLTSVYFYSGANNFWFMQGVFNYRTDNVTHGIGLTKNT